MIRQRNQHRPRRNLCRVARPVDRPKASPWSPLQGDPAGFACIRCGTLTATYEPILTVVRDSLLSRGLAKAHH